MNYNPYVAPQAAPPGPGGPGGPGAWMGGSGPQPWDVGEVFGLAWEMLKTHWVVLVFAPLLAQVVGNVPGRLPQMLAVTHVMESDSLAFALLSFVCAMVSFSISAFFNVGLLRIFLTTARGGTPEFGELFNGFSRFGPMWATMFLFAMVVAVGSFFLVVPGVIAACGLCFAMFFCVDAELGPIEALQQSWAATSGQKGKLFVLFLLGFAAILAGLIACCVGVFVAVPVVWMATTIAFLRSTGRGGPPPAMAYGGPPPGGGYGGPPGGGYGGPPGGGYGGPPGGGGGYGT